MKPTTAAPFTNTPRLGAMVVLAGLVALSLLGQTLFAPAQAVIPKVFYPQAPVLIMLRPRSGGHVAAWPLLPSFVLYADGVLLSTHRTDEISVSWPPPYAMRQTRLSTQQLCGLLDAIEQAGTLDLPTTEREDTWARLGGWYAELNIGEPHYLDSQSLNAQETLIFEQLRQRLELLAQTGTPYTFTRAALVMRVQNDVWDVAAPRWPSTLPSLASLSQGQAEVIVELTGATAQAVYAQLKTETFYRENGVTYWLVARPLLPAEALNDTTASTLYLSDGPSQPLLTHFPSAGVTLPCPLSQSVPATPPPTGAPPPTPLALNQLPQTNLIEPLAEIGNQDAPRQLYLPNAVAFSPAGEVVVADKGNHRLQWFTPEGTLLRITTLPTGVAVNNVTFGPQAEVIVVSDHEVVILDPTGRVQRRFAAWATAPTEEGWLAHIATAPNGTLYIATWGGEAVGIWTMAGQHIGTWAGDAKSPLDVRDLETDALGNVYLLSQPIGRATRNRVYRRAPDGSITELRLTAEAIAPAADGTFYLLQAQPPTISHYAASGEVLAQWPRIPDFWFLEVDLAVAPDDAQLVMLDGQAYEGNLKIYTATGTLLHAFGFTYGDPRFGQFYGHVAFAVAPQGQVWLINTGEGPQRLLYVAANGDLLHYFDELPETLFKCDTYYLAATAQASVWVADACLGQLTQVDATGQILAQWTGEFDLMSGLALATDEQSLLITDSARHELLRLSLAGEVLERWDTATWGVTKPKAVVGDTAGGIYLLDAAQPQLLLWANAASPRTVPLPLPNSYINYHLAVDAQRQRIYVSGWWLQAFDTAGTFLGQQDLTLPKLGVDAAGNLYASTGRDRISIYAPSKP